MKKDERIFFEEQLYKAMKALSKARSVKEVKALQDRIKFLKKILEGG